MNAEAVRHLAAACRAAGSVLVQISTDYVFGGPGPRQVPYREADLPDPRCVYARTKLDGERYAAASPRHYLIRTCGLFGCSPRRNNFVEAILRRAQEGRPLRVVCDQACTPSYVGCVTRAVRFLLTREAYGTYHVVNSGSTTWYEFAQEILRQAGVATPVEPITTEQYGAPAARPVYSVLDTAKYHALGGPPMPPWNVALAEYLAERARPEAED